MVQLEKLLANEALAELLQTAVLPVRELRRHRVLRALVQAIQRVLDVRAEHLTRQGFERRRQVLAGQVLAEGPDVLGVGGRSSLRI
ncbi:hypothetical protein [Nocardia sp. NPDC051833]|uniref:hypothetical protein n=1 Tax=Nocardia sp. NPDC051833 TaxID=3155674 RepID=UPI00343F2CFF